MMRDLLLDKKFFGLLSLFLFLVIGQSIAKCLLLMVLLITYRPRDGEVQTRLALILTPWKLESFGGAAEELAKAGRLWL